MRKVVVIFTLMVILSGTVGAMGIPNYWTGQQWKELTQKEKMMFIAGSAFASNQLVLAMGGAEKDMISLSADYYEYYLTQTDLWFEAFGWDKTILEMLSTLGIRDPFFE